MKEYEKVTPSDFLQNFVRNQYGDFSVDIEYKFKNGYCYYLARMLKLAYGRGTVCWTAPFGHFVWVDSVDNIAYDIEGVYNPKDHDTFYLIPEERLGDLIYDFYANYHPGIFKGASKQELIDIVKKYCEDTGETYDPEIEKYFG